MKWKILPNPRNAKLAREMARRDSSRVRNLRKYDRGSYLTKSRTREGDHAVDIEEMTCTCEGFDHYGTCDHLRAAVLRKIGARKEIAKRVKHPITIQFA